MGKRLAGGVSITTATFLTFISSHPQKEEIVQEFIFQESENSHLLKGEQVVDPASVTLIEPIDGIRLKFD